MSADWMRRPHVTVFASTRRAVTVLVGGGVAAAVLGVASLTVAGVAHGGAALTTRDTRVAANCQETVQAWAAAYANPSGNDDTWRARVARHVTDPARVQTAPRSRPEGETATRVDGIDERACSTTVRWSDGTHWRVTATPTPRGNGWVVAAWDDLS